MASGSSKVMWNQFFICSVLLASALTWGQSKIDLVEINGNWWAISNLRATTFRNGDPIQNAKTRDEWITCLQEGVPAYCAYMNDTAHANRYGYLYNWFAISDPRGLAPEKTRIAHNGDFSNLYIHINQGVSNYPGMGLVGKRLKSINGWESSEPGENQYDFNILPGGYRNENGEFVGIRRETAIWLRDTMSYGIRSLGYAYSSPYALIHSQKRDMLFQNDGKRTGCYVRIVLGDEFLDDN